ncbi:MAG: beta-ketoacyl synthase N-terminal-like domain-containing protein, partial [Bradymonadaceae bacterium]
MSTDAQRRDADTGLYQGARPELSDADQFIRAVADAGAIPTLSVGTLPADRLEERLAEVAAALGRRPIVMALTSAPSASSVPERVECAAASDARLDSIAVEPAHADAARSAAPAGVDVFEVVDADRILDDGVDGGDGPLEVQVENLGRLSQVVDALAEMAHTVRLQPSAVENGALETAVQAVDRLDASGADASLAIPGRAYLGTEEAVHLGAVDGSLQDRLSVPEVGRIDDLHRRVQAASSSNPESRASDAAAATEDTDVSAPETTTRTSSMNQTNDTRGLDPDRAIAVVGIGAKMPEALSADQYWSNIKNEVYAIQETPKDRWDPELYWDPDPDAPDKTYSKIGGWITDFDFDRKWYRIPPLVVDHMDGAQLLALETTREALDDAGYLDGEATRLDADFEQENCAVVLGNTLCGEQRDWTNLRVMYPEFEMTMRRTLLEEADLSQRQIDSLLDSAEEQFKSRFHEITEDSMPGELPNVIAGQVAQLFNLRGPNYTTDAACAGSLASVAQAVRGLRTDEYDVAVTG